MQQQERALTAAMSRPQVLVQGMIDAWGPNGLEQHARTMQKAYAHRAQVVLAAAGAPLRLSQGQSQVRCEASE